MAFHSEKKLSELSARQNHGLMSREQILNRKAPVDEFYEFETAVVLDIILDEQHPIFVKLNPTIDPENHPGSPVDGDIDYSWFGKALVRMTVSDVGKDINSLAWATPIQGSGQDYPLKNELVYVVKYMGQLYYGKLNTRNFVNHNADFRYEKKYGLNEPVLGNSSVLSYTRNKSIKDTRSDFKGVLGNYFRANDNIRSLKRFEGDSIIESRFGQSIRFSAYDSIRSNDTGHPDYKTYKDFGGNPMILIRNRQRDIISPTQLEKNVGGVTLEDINLDGSSIHITSGKTVSSWNENDVIKIKPFQSNNSGPFSSNYYPSGSTPFKYPKLDGDQIILNSDRIIISSKKNELFLCSVGRLALFTDSETTIDSEKQIVISSNDSFHVNSPYIFLGDYGVAEEALFLGNSASKWLYELIGWLRKHTHLTGSSKTKTTPELAELSRLESLIPSLISDRVYTSGRNTISGNKITQSSNPPVISRNAFANRTKK
jgi:hypothetical protein